MYCTAVSSGMYDTCHADVFDRTVSTAGGIGGHGPATGHTPLGTLCRSVIIILGPAGRAAIIISVITLVAAGLWTSRCNVSFLIAVIARVVAEIMSGCLGCRGTVCLRGVAVVGAGR